MDFRFQHIQGAKTFTKMMRLTIKTGSESRLINYERQNTYSEWNIDYGLLIIERGFLMTCQGLLLAEGVFFNFIGCDCGRKIRVFIDGLSGFVKDVYCLL